MMLQAYEQKVPVLQPAVSPSIRVEVLNSSIMDGCTGSIPAEAGVCQIRETKNDPFLFIGNKSVTVWCLPWHLQVLRPFTLRTIDRFDIQM